MSFTLILNTAAGISMVVAGGLIGVKIWLAISEDVDNDEAQYYLALSASGLVAVAAAILGMYALGFARATLWAWRITGATDVIASSIAWYRGASNAVARSAAARRVAALSVVVSLVIASGSFFVRAGPAPTGRVVTVTAAPTVISIQGVSLWYGVSMGLLALFTVLFLALFIRAMERGNMPAVESHWGGFGGDRSGWRVSASLTYLAGATVFGVLFAIFVFQLAVNQANQSSRTPLPATSGQTSTSTPTPVGEPATAKSTAVQSK